MDADICSGRGFTSTLVTFDTALDASQYPGALLNIWTSGNCQPPLGLCTKFPCLLFALLVCFDVAVDFYIMMSLFPPAPFHGNTCGSHSQFWKCRLTAQTGQRSNTSRRVDCGREVPTRLASSEVKARDGVNRRTNTQRLIRFTTHANLPPS